MRTNSKKSIKGYQVATRSCLPECRERFARPWRLEIHHNPYRAVHGMEKRDPIPHGQLGRGRQPTQPSWISRQRAKLVSQPFITANRSKSHQGRDRQFEPQRWPYPVKLKQAISLQKKALTTPVLSPFEAGRSLGTILASPGTHDKIISIILWLPRKTYHWFSSGLNTLVIMEKPHLLTWITVSSHSHF